MATKKMELEICGVQIETHQALETATFLLDGSTSPKKIDTKTIIEYFKPNSDLCVITSYDLLDVDTFKVSDKDILNNSFNFSDSTNFKSLSSNSPIKFSSDKVVLDKKNQEVIDLNLGQTIVVRKYIKATTITGHFAIQPLEITIKKTYNAAPKFVGSSIKDLRELDVTISQKEILEGKSDPLIFMLPEVTDLEQDEISIEIKAPEMETWVSVIDTELGTAFQIDPLKIRHQDNGEHNFEIHLKDDQTREKSIYDIKINIKYISYSLFSSEEKEIIQKREQEIVEVIRGEPDYSKPRPSVRVSTFKVTHLLQI